MICFFTNQQIPPCGIVFGEKAILEESYEPSLDKLRFPGIFIPVSPTVSKCLNPFGRFCGPKTLFAWDLHC